MGTIRSLSTCIDPGGIRWEQLDLCAHALILGVLGGNN